MDKLFLRAFAKRKEGEPGKAGDPIHFIASTQGIKRDGKDLDANKWNLENYRKNPVFLWAHDYMGRNLPIGRSEVEIQGKQLIAIVTFDQADEFARQVEDKYRRSYLNAVSVGWLDIVRCQKCQTLIDAWTYWVMGTFRMKCPGCGTELTEKNIDLEYDLLDISGVPVPGDADALMERELAALRSYIGERDGARPYPNEHACRVRDPGDFEEGSFRRVKREHEGKEYSVIMGRLTGESTMTEQAYRYPKDTWTEKEARAHCKSHDGISFEPASGESGEGDWSEAAAEMVKLFHAPAPDDTDEHRLQRYRALLPVYRRAGKVAPEFRTIDELAALGEEEIEGLFLEGEIEDAPGLPKEQADLAKNARAGAVLNARNRGDLEQAVTLIQGVLERAKKEEDQGEGDRGINNQQSSDEELALAYAILSNRRI